MIEAVIFDLDGTLVQTERLKAISYARAALELSPGHVTEKQFVEAFKDVVGLSRQEVAEALLQRFELQEAVRVRMGEFDVLTPWQAFLLIRLRFYEQMLADSKILHDHRCPYNVELLNYVRANNLKTGLATMSYCSQVNRVLDILKLRDQFDFIASRDDVENGKPDPEIYLLVARQLQAEAANCLVIEDSPAGVKAALAAGMRCIVVTTDFTRKTVHKSDLIEKGRIVDDPANLGSVAAKIIEQR
ncbi:MAG: HAD family hydrolase [bacterium]